VEVRPENSGEPLAARVLMQEHVMYVDAVRWFLEEHISVSNGSVRLASATGCAAALNLPQG